MATLNTLRNPGSSSALCQETKDYIRALQQFNTLHVTWVKGHNNNTGNEFADYLAKRGNALPQLVTDPAVPIGQGYVKTQINATYYGKWQDRWEETTDLKHTRRMQPKPERHTGRIKKSNRRSLNLTFQIITGHALLGAHLGKWQGVPKLCKKCDSTDETPEHLWKDCPTMYYDRWVRDVTYVDLTHVHDAMIRFFREHRLIELDE